MSDDPSCMSMITRYRDQRQCTALVPFFGQGSEGAQAWLRMHTSEHRRIAMRAAREKDYGTLWSLTEAWLRTFSVAGATIATKTIANHRLGVRRLLEAWAREDLLKPDPDAASFYISQMERDGLRPGTIQTRVAAARHLYAALRWARATMIDPCADCHVPHDPTSPWDKRMPYDNDERAALLQATTDRPFDHALILLGAHAGLRAGECVALRWADVNLAGRDLTIRQGKGGKTRTVAMSTSLKQALQTLPRNPDGYVLPYRAPQSAWRHITAVCDRAGVAPKGMHSLRHSAGTRLFAETRDLEETARHLGHVKLETTRIYAKWSNKRLRETLGRW